MRTMHIVFCVSSRTLFPVKDCYRSAPDCDAKETIKTAAQSHKTTGKRCFNYSETTFENSPHLRCLNVVSRINCELQSHDTFALNTGRHWVLVKARLRVRLHAFFLQTLLSVLFGASEHNKIVSKKSHKNQSRACLRCMHVKIIATTHDSYRSKPLIVCSL